MYFSEEFGDTTAAQFANSLAPFGFELLRGEVNGKPGD